MASSESGEKAVRIERLRSIVNDDYQRVAGTEDPYEILSLDAGASWEDAAARYERYERFYRAENFQRLGDMDLTRKALDVRRAVGRAIVEIQGIGDAGTGTDPPSVSDLDPDSRALGDIYYRDGLTYLRLGDLDAAVDSLKRATEHDPASALALAYLAYTNYRRRPSDSGGVAESRENMRRATRMGPDEPDVHVLAARFFLKLQEVDAAVDSIEKVRTLAPDHAKLDALDERLQRARAASV